MILKIGNRVSIEVASCEEASRVYAQYRDASLDGASTFPDGTILGGGRIIARVSYNARVWPPAKWREDQVPFSIRKQSRHQPGEEEGAGKKDGAGAHERGGCLPMPPFRSSHPHAILIHAPEPGYDRFKVARDIQNACNTSGVARELIRVIEDAARDPQCGRGRLAHDPAVAAVIDKLSSLMRLDPFEAHDACARRSAPPVPAKGTG